MFSNKANKYNVPTSSGFYSGAKNGIKETMRRGRSGYSNIVPDRRVEKEPKEKAEKRGIPLIIPVVLLVVFLIMAAGARPAIVTGQSMEPTLHEGDIILVDPLAYKKVPPERGDIVVMSGEALGVADKNIVKRVAARPLEKYGDIKIPYGFLYVLGDNKDNSYDSRAVGAVDGKYLKGQAWLRLAPDPKILL